jgi:exodeoxyribonuclease-3
MKIATWNVNSLRQRMDHVEQWVCDSKVDVLCLQETKVTDAEFPAQQLKAMGFTHQAFWGQKSYNGVAICSRLPLENVQKGFTFSEPDPQTRLIVATINQVRIFCCYVPNGHAVGSEKFSYKLQWLEKLKIELAHQIKSSPLTLVLGDLNIAPGDADVHDPFSCEGQLLFHKDEHQALAQVMGDTLHDAFRERNPFRCTFSWFDYRNMAFKRNHGMRIDHILVTKDLLEKCTDVSIDRDVRGWEKPSDHVPVWASFEL